MCSKHCDEAVTHGPVVSAAPANAALVTRIASPADLGSVAVLENKVFTSDRMSRRSIRHLLASPHAVALVAERDGRLCGVAFVLIRRTSDVARLYSIAVDPDCAGRGLGGVLLAAAEEGALARNCQFLRLEVHENNARAIALYRRAGYREFGRHHEYYQDKGHALRFEKRLLPPLTRLADAPPYVRQTAEFTSGAACLVMALAWADQSFCPSAITELRLWREAATIFMSNGPGGCEPFGMAVALERRGLCSEIYVNRRGPYFFDTVHSADKRRVMAIAQEDFAAEANARGVAVRLRAADEPALLRCLDAGGAAIMLVSGGRVTRRKGPHWVFAFGRDGPFVLVHDPAARGNELGGLPTLETCAFPLSAFMRMTRCGRDHLSAAILIQKRVRS